MTNPTLMSMPICRDAEKNTIPVTDNGTTGKFSEQYGWQSINSLPLSAGGKAVERLDFNGILALLGGIDYMTQRGYTFEWDSNLPYVVGCIVIDTLDGKTYRCINDVPAGSPNPSLDPTNWVVYEIADYVGGAVRLANYAVGDTSTLVGIPAGYFLECTTAGTTGATAPVITPPVSAGQTISDGTVVWTVRKCFPTSGGALTGTSLTWNGDDLGDSAIVAKAIGPNGYIKRASGEIVQWGIITLPQNSTIATGTLPIAFTSINTARIVANVNYTGSTSAVRAINISLPTASTITAVTNTPITTGGVGITWIAIGY